jgi:DNA-directed RNA polymerase alpha subunit
MGSMTIADLALSSRSYSRLAGAGIATTDALLALGETRLVNLRGLDLGSVQGGLLRDHAILR